LRQPVSGIAGFRSIEEARILLRLALGASALALAATAFAATDPFEDPLDVPARAVRRQLLSTQMHAVTRAGARLVAVGVRGLLLVSDDEGRQWKQVSVPVASDLLAVHFPTARDGWAVGHDGVVLRTQDGGNTWGKQLDGRIAKQMLTVHFQALAASGDAQARRHLEDTEINYAGGPEQSLLGVWFKDALSGFVCGSFGTLLATDDGGMTWKSWIEKVDADRPLHLNAIRGTREGVLIASEKGIVFRLDPDKQRFVAMPTGYAGTFFRLLEAGDSVLAAGLRGTVYRLKSGGASWEKVETGVTSTITAAMSLPDGSALLGTVAGQLLATRDGERFRQIPVALPMPFTGIAPASPDEVVVVGMRGVRKIPFKVQGQQP